MEAGSPRCPACAAEVVSDAVACWACGSPLAVKACPVCEGTLAPKAVGEVSALACGACSGLWVDRATFEALAVRTVPAAGLAPLSHRRCPDCGQADSILVEVCRSHGLWFDAEELERAQSFVRRGRPSAAAMGAQLPPAPALRAPAPSGPDFSDALEVAGDVISVLAWIADLLPDE